MLQSVWLTFESFSARCDAHVRLLRAENAILKSRLKGRVICSPKERALLLNIGSELNHQVRDVITIVKPKTYRRWVKEQAEGGRRAK